MTMLVVVDHFVDKTDFLYFFFAFSALRSQKQQMDGSCVCYEQPGVV